MYLQERADSFNMPGVLVFLENKRGYAIVRGDKVLRIPVRHRT